MTSWLQQHLGAVLGGFYAAGRSSKAVSGIDIAALEFACPNRPSLWTQGLHGRSDRLMIFNGFTESRSKEIAERLAERVREFNGSRAEDAWLLAAWEGTRENWWFRYFTIELDSRMEARLDTFPA